MIGTYQRSGCIVMALWFGGCCDLYFMFACNCKRKFSTFFCTCTLLLPWPPPPFVDVSVGINWLKLSYRVSSCSALMLLCILYKDEENDKTSLGGSYKNILMQQQQFKAVEFYSLLWVTVITQCLIRHVNSVHVPICDKSLYTILNLNH